MIMVRRPWKPKKAFDEVAFVAWLARIEDKSGCAPYYGESRQVLRARCSHAGCTCDHLFPCEAGWIEVTNGGPSHGMLFACNICRPAASAVQREAGDRETLQAKIRNPEYREQATNAHAWS
jgi:hypothetical protein